MLSKGIARELVARLVDEQLLIICTVGRLDYYVIVLKKEVSYLNVVVSSARREEVIDIFYACRKAGRFPFCLVCRVFVKLLIDHGKETVIDWRNVS